MYNIYCALRSSSWIIDPGLLSKWHNQLTPVIFYSLIYGNCMIHFSVVKQGGTALSHPLRRHKKLHSQTWISHGTLRSARGATTPTTEWLNRSLVRAVWFAVLYCAQPVSSLFAAFFLFPQNAQMVRSQRLLWLRTPRGVPISAGKMMYLVSVVSKKKYRPMRER